MIAIIMQIVSSMIGSKAFGGVLISGLDWYLNKNKTDRESRELAVSLAMSLRRQGLTTAVLSFESDDDAKTASENWDEIERQIKKSKELEGKK